MKYERFYQSIKYVLISLVFVLLISFLISSINGSDIWFHLKLGEWITGNLKVPFSNTFSFINPGQPWIDSHWLFQVIVYSMFIIGGLNGLIILQGLVVMFAFILLFRLKYDKQLYLLAVFLMFLVITIVRERFMIRPEFFTFFFIVVYLRILNEYKYRKSDYIILLPVIHIIWVNMHGLYILGMVIVGSYIVGELIAWKVKLPFVKADRAVIKNSMYRKLVLVFFVMLACSFINPYLHKGFMYPFRLFMETGSRADSFMRGITELGAAVPFSFKVIVSLAVISFIVNIRKLSLTYLILFLSFLYLSFQARRNTAIAAIVFFPIIMHNAAGIKKEVIDYLKSISSIGIIKRFKIVLPVVMVALLGVVIVDVVSGRYYLRNKEQTRFGFGVIDELYPGKAIDFIIENNISGNLYNDNLSGGYFIWRCYPERKVFLDGRWEAYDSSFLHYYWKVSKNVELFGDMAEKYDFNYTLLNHSSAEAKKLFPVLHGDGKWKLVWFDESASVFLKDTSENRLLIDKYRVVFNDSSLDEDIINKGGMQLIYYNRGKLLYNAGLYAMARKDFEKSLRVYPRSFVHGDIGSCWFKEGIFAEAEKSFRKAIELNNRDEKAYYNLGLVFYKKGLYKKAIGEFEKAIKVKPVLSAYLDLAKAGMQTGEFSLVVEAGNNALALSPDFAEAYNLIGIAYGSMGEYDMAVEVFVKGLFKHPDDMELKRNYLRVVESR